MQDNYKKIILDDGKEIVTKAIVITTGVDYRQLTTPGIPDFTGAGVYYGAATDGSCSCKGNVVFVVGGGNSAGQAAMYLSKFARQVNILIRKDSLSYTMSSYLIDQIKGVGNICVCICREVVEAKGNGRLEQVVIKNTLLTKLTRKMPQHSIFSSAQNLILIGWIKKSSPMIKGL